MVHCVEVTTKPFIALAFLFLINHFSVIIKLSGKLECGPMPNVMVALPNIGGALFNATKFG